MRQRIDLAGSRKLYWRACRRPRIYARGRRVASTGLYRPIADYTPVKFSGLSSSFAPMINNARTHVTALWICDAVEGPGLAGGDQVDVESERQAEADYQDTADTTPDRPLEAQ